MVGSSVCRKLKQSGYHNIITRSHSDLDLINNSRVTEFFSAERPEVVILAAAKVGGIQANIDAPAEFLFDNLSIQNNVIHNSHLHGVKKFIFLGSSCIYPKDCPQPMKEDHLLTGSLEPTNEGYALAKITGLKLIEYYKNQYNFDGFTLLPCNLYGTNDHFDLKKSHVLSSLVRRFCDGAENNDPKITLWGNGEAKREFMHVDDFSDALIHFIKTPPKESFINIGVGKDISIKELAQKISNAANFSGQILWDTSKPNGMMKKCLDVSRQIDTGFIPSITLDDGILQTINEYLELKQNGKIR